MYTAHTLPGLLETFLASAWQRMAVAGVAGCVVDALGEVGDREAGRFAS